MKCKCGREMRYFKDWEKNVDGYLCDCGEEKISKTHFVEEEEGKDL